MTTIRSQLNDSQNTYRNYLKQLGGDEENQKTKKKIINSIIIYIT